MSDEMFWKEAMETCAARLQDGIAQLNSAKGAGVELSEADCHKLFWERFEPNFKQYVTIDYWAKNGETLETAAGFMGFIAAQRAYGRGAQAVVRQGDAQEAIEAAQVLCQARLAAKKKRGDDGPGIGPLLVVCEGV